MSSGSMSQVRRNFLAFDLSVLDFGSKLMRSNHQVGSVLGDAEAFFWGHIFFRRRKCHEFVRSNPLTRTDRGHHPTARRGSVPRHRLWHHVAPNDAANATQQVVASTDVPRQHDGPLHRKRRFMSFTTHSNGRLFRLRPQPSNTGQTRPARDNLFVDASLDKNGSIHVRNLWLKFLRGTPCTAQSHVNNNLGSSEAREMLGEHFNAPVVVCSHADVHVAQACVEPHLNACLMEQARRSGRGGEFADSPCPCTCTSVHPSGIQRGVATPVLGRGRRIRSSSKTRNRCAVWCTQGQWERRGPKFRDFLFSYPDLSFQFSFSILTTFCVDLCWRSPVILIVLYVVGKKIKCLFTCRMFSRSFQLSGA